MKQHGYTTLLLLLIILAGVLTFGAVVIFRSIETSQATVTLEEMARAYGAVNACMEEALQRLKLDAFYTGSAGLDIAGIPCTTAVTGGGPAYMITAQTETPRAVRKIEADVTRSGNRITLLNWRESY